VGSCQQAHDCRGKVNFPTVSDPPYLRWAFQFSVSQVVSSLMLRWLAERDMVDGLCMFFRAFREPAVTLVADIILTPPSMSRAVA